MRSALSVWEDKHEVVAGCKPRDLRAAKSSYGGLDTVVAQLPILSERALLSTDTTGWTMKARDLTARLESPASGSSTAFLLDLVRGCHTISLNVVPRLVHECHRRRKSMERGP